MLTSIKHFILEHKLTFSSDCWILDFSDEVVYLGDNGILCDSCYIVYVLKADDSTIMC